MILKSIQHNVRDTFLSRLYEQYSEYIYKLAWDACPSAQDVDDLVQTIWEKLIRKEQTLQKLDHPQLLNYISKTLKNTLREEARKKKHITCSLDLVVGYSTDQIDRINDSIDRALQCQLFKEVWLQVDEDVRELLERKYDLHESDEEIAQAMGIKAASIRMYLTRAKRSARKELASHKERLLR